MGDRQHDLPNALSGSLRPRLTPSCVRGLHAAGLPDAVSFQGDNMRRQATEEQKAKAIERRERFRQLVKHVSAMSEDERTALVMKCGAIVTCEGRALSPLNSCLILTQFPTASMVGGFLQWKDHGRSVKKGAVGISIWVPTGRKKEQAELKEISEGKEKPGGFIMGTIFDITQTEVSKAPDWRERQQLDKLREEAIAADVKL